MSSPVDLSQLAVHRETAAADAIRPPPRNLFSRYVLPAGVLLGFVGVLAWAARDSLFPAKEVTVVPVFVSKTLQQAEGTPLFTSAGWVEPSPFPIQVTALAEGVVEKLLVIDGESVEKNQPIAQLIRRDAELALARAQAEREMREADVQSAEAQLAAAKITLEQPVQLDAALAEIDAMLARSQTELGNIKPEIQAAEARLVIARLERDGKKNAGEGVVSLRAIQRAQSEYESGAAMLDELRQREPRLQKEIDALTRRRDAIAKQRELKTEEIRRVAESQSNLASMTAKLHQSHAEEQLADLRLERMTVRSPMAGKVLARVAREGTRLMGLKAESEQDSSTVVTMYDPEKLQVRADVRLEDVPRLTPNQPVRIETAAVDKPFPGHVLIVTSTADIQKNTLSVKVLIENPPPQIKPEMLVKVTFLATAENAPKNGAEAATKDRIYVPKPLVLSDEAGSYVWLADQATGVARRRNVRVGSPGNENLVEVEGLSISDKVIVGGREGLRDGQRISVKGEDHGTG